MQMLKSKKGIVRSEAAWRADLDAFWHWVLKQNNAIRCHRNLDSEPSEKMQRRLFKRPADAWEREVRLLGLVPVQTQYVDILGLERAWRGVFGE